MLLYIIMTREVLKMNDENYDRNPRFYQFNKQVTPELLYELAPHPTALRILSVFLYCSGPLGTIIISQKDIHQETHHNRSNISEAIQYLRHMGIIAIKKMGIQNIYIINPGFIWRKSNYLRHAITNNVKFNKIHINSKMNQILHNLNKKSISVVPLEYLKHNDN